MNEIPTAPSHFIHIKKKTLLEAIFTPEEFNQISNNPGMVTDFIPANIQNVEKSKPIILISDQKAYTAFHYQHGEVRCCIPIANPVLIYFNVAQSQLKELKDSKKKLLDQFEHPEKMDEDGLYEFYHYFGMISTFVTQLINAMEAVVNQKIPYNYIYQEEDGNKCTKHYNIDQIQRHLSIEKKITRILNVIESKDFAKDHKEDYGCIKELQSLRNDIVHTKAQNYDVRYIELYQKSLNFNVLTTIYAVSKFINYYNPGLIEHCDCGRDS